MARLVRETNFGSSTFGCNLGKCDVSIHHVKLMVSTQIFGESTSCTIAFF